MKKFKSGNHNREEEKDKFLHDSFSGEPEHYADYLQEAIDDVLGM